MQYAVTAQYQHDSFEQNEIISIHESYESAETAANNASCQSIRAFVGEAKVGDNYRALEIAGKIQPA